MEGRQEQINSKELNKYSEYDKIREFICDVTGKVRFYYDFNDMNIITGPPTSMSTLQRCKIKITSDVTKVDYNLVHKYSCGRCGKSIEKKTYETVSTHGKIRCKGVYKYINVNGEKKERMCGKRLTPNDKKSITKDAFRFTIEYEDNGNKYYVEAISFLKLKCEETYECVLFKTGSHKHISGMHHIMVVRRVI